WTGQTYRPTRDLDLAGYGDSSPDKLRQIFSDVCRVAVEPDGLVFEPDSIRVTEIREEQEYPGQRVRLRARLGQAEISLQIDIGFGDALTPAPAEAEYPTLLNFPAPRLKVCPKETVIAEKLQAMVALGMVNSRMKDFYDIWLMAQQFSFEGQVLVQAIRSTFERRQTEIPANPPVALTAKFGQDLDKQKMWLAFLERSRVEMTLPEFTEVIDQIAGFLNPPVAAIVDKLEFKKNWPSGGPWKR
ncbi:MAG: nucleotidyl transferase AbiEii/AbiGii toxin family protein, partial [Chloroflexota bacterium]